MNDQDNYIPFSRPDLRDEDIAAVERVLRSGWLTTGPEVRAFEEAFATYVGARYAVALNSCTAALHLALAAAGVGRGDVVLCPTYTFAATAEVVQYLDAVPVLIDSRADDLNLDVEQLEVAVHCLTTSDRRAAAEAAVDQGRLAPGTARALAATTGPLKAIVPVHFAGVACDMGRVIRIAAEAGVPVIEDAAHALETTWGDRKVGSIGDITAFSFYATKNLATGEGGMATTDDPDLAATMRQLSLHGISRDAWKRYTSTGSWRYDIETVGFKYNMTDVAAALGLSQLARVEESHARRVQIARRYSEAFADLPGVRVPADSASGVHAWHLFVLRVEGGVARDDVIDRLRESGIGTSVHFIPLHVHSHYRNRFGYAPGDFPAAERAFDQVISLPLYPGMTDAEVERVIVSVAGAMRAE